MEGDRRRDVGDCIVYCCPIAHRQKEKESRPGQYNYVIFVSRSILSKHVFLR